MKSTLKMSFTLMTYLIWYMKWGPKKVQNKKKQIGTNKGWINERNVYIGLSTPQSHMAKMCVYEMSW